MEDSADSTCNAAVHSLTGPMDIYTCHAVAQQLQEYLKGTSAVSLDLSGVTSCDLAGLQLLCSARRSAQVADKPFELITLPPDFLALLEKSGLPADFFIANQTQSPLPTHE